MGRAELTGLDQAEALVHHWLGQAPAEDWDEFALQTKQALWLEERRNTFLAKVLGAKMK